MGRLAAEDMVANASFEQALVWHLTGNHYPPIHKDFHAPAKQAIELANEGDFDTIITLPNGKALTVAKVISGLHLEAFVIVDGEGSAE